MSSLTAAPTATGAATPASGFIKIKQWNSVAYSDNTAITFSAGTVTCNVNGTDVVGTISLCNDEAGTITGRRLGTLRFRGAWYDLGTTDGVNTTTYQIPTHGEALYLPGVQVETGTSTGVYEWYPNMGSQTALVANIGTEAARGKVCWISSAGVLRFQHDGTNSTGGYLPPSGRKIRIPNVFMHSCTTAARGTNAVPNSTLGTRFEFVAAGAQITMDTVTTGWYMNIAQPYSLSLTNTGIMDTLLVSELASAATWSQICIAPTQAQSNTALNMSLDLAGGTISDSVIARYSLASSGNYIASLTDCDSWDFSSTQLRNIAATRGNNTTGAATLIRSNNSDWSGCTIIGGRLLHTTCSNVTHTNLVYIDVPASTTPTGQPMYAIDLSGGACSYIKIDGMTFGGLTLVQPYSGLLQVGVGCSNVKMRNIGSAATPLDLGGARLDGISWSRTTTTATITSTSHGLKTNDIIYVIISSDVSAITVASKTITVTNANTFTFTCLNAGGASGTLSYYPTMSAYAVLIASNAAANTIKVQRVYTTHTRSGPYSADNSNKNVLYESLWADMIHAPVTAELNCQLKGAVTNHALTAQTNPVYGSHMIDFYTTDTPTNLSAQSWTRSTTTATLTSNSHGLRTGDRIIVTVSSDTAAIVLGAKSITATGVNTFTFTCLNAGSASGTLTYVAENGKIAILANEASAQTTSYVTIDAGTPNFTASGTVYFPAINDQITWYSQDYIKGHNSFPIDEIVMGAGTLADYEIFYALDTGSGYGSFKNLSYRRITGGGSSSSTTVTMADTTGVAVNDYVFGTNIAPQAKVVTVDSSTNITVDKANTGTVSGTLRFNQLPNETISDPSTGFKMKIKVVAKNTASTAWSSIYIWTNSTSTTRGYQYTLDYATVSMSGLVTGSRVKATKVSDGTLLYSGAESSGAISFQTDYIGAIQLEARKASSAPYYKPFVTQVTSVADTTVSAVALQQTD